MWNIRKNSIYIGFSFLLFCVYVVSHVIIMLYVLLYHVQWVVPVWLWVIPSLEDINMFNIILNNVINKVRAVVYVIHQSQLERIDWHSEKGQWRLQTYTIPTKGLGVFQMALFNIHWSRTWKLCTYTYILE